MKYIAIATNSHIFEPIAFKSESITEARHWVINHLDCSNTWHIMELTGTYASSFTECPTADDSVLSDT